MSKLIIFHNSGTITQTVEIDILFRTMLESRNSNLVR